VNWFDPLTGLGSISRAGFVTRDAGGADVAVRARVLDPTHVFDEGDVVIFTLENDHDGLRATDVRSA